MKFTSILVPEDKAAEIANTLGRQLAYPLRDDSVTTMKGYQIGDRVRERPTPGMTVDGELVGERVGTVVGFGYQPLGSHLVVRVDGDPPEREGYFLLNQIEAWQSKDKTTGFGVVELPPENPGQED